MELLTYRLSDPNDKSKDLAKKITELVVASSVTIKEAMDAIRLSNLARIDSRSNFTSSETAMDAMLADSEGKFLLRDSSVRALNTSKKRLRSFMRETSIFAPPFSCDSTTGGGR